MNLIQGNGKLKQWLVETPLYESLIDYSYESAISAIEALISTDQPFDMYCPDCGAHSTFTPEPNPDALNGVKHANMLVRNGHRSPLFNIDDFQVVAYCARSRAHVARYFFLHNRGQNLMKVGQFPSLADLSIPDTAQFQEALGKNRIRELNKAIGLAAHGVGVGSYIYLRRVFESLVEEAHEIARKLPGWDEEEYQRSRMLEKISLVKAHLPKFLVEHPQLHGILSKHIHELSEDECLKNFELMKEAVLIIARDKKAAHDEARHRERTAKLLGTVGSAISGKS